MKMIVRLLAVICAYAFLGIQNASVQIPPPGRSCSSRAGPCFKHCMEKRKDAGVCETRCGNKVKTCHPTSIWHGRRGSVGGFNPR
jgi:hypothetical protein